LFKGNLYGLEKFWAFLKYYKGKKNFEVSPEVKLVLDPFKEVDDFRREVTFFGLLLIDLRGALNPLVPMCQNLFTFSQ